MSVSTTETKTFFGIVVATGESDVDPYAMGRVKVLCPSIHHKDIEIDKLPWCTVASSSNGLGDHTFQRQIVVGSVVEVYFSGGTKSSNQGIIRSVINGVHTEEPQEQPSSSEFLTKTGYIDSARNMSVKGASGPSQIGQTKTDPSPQQSGISFVASDTSPHPSGGKGGSINISGEYNEYPNMHMREGIDSSVTSKGFIRTSKPIRTINTAEQWAQLTFDTGDGKNDVPPIENKGQDYVFDKSLGEGIPDPTLKKGYENFVDYLQLRYSSENKTNNFANEGNRTDLSAWKGIAKGLLSSVTTHKALHDALFMLQSQTILEPPLKSKQSQASIETPFGQMQRINYWNGDLEFPDFDSPNNNKWDFIKECVNVTLTARSLINGGSLLTIEEWTDHNGGSHTISKFEEKVGLYEKSLVPGEVFLRLNTSSAKEVWQTILDCAEEQRPLNVEYARFGSGEFITKKPPPLKISIKGVE